MLGKLAFRNIKKSGKDYLIYFVTIVLSFALIYAFNALVFSEDIQNVSKQMVNFKYTIVFMSVIVVFVIGYLIYYTTKFMLEKRGKEFGIYLILGMDNKKVANLFFTENLILGFMALLCSFLVGSLLYQMLVSIILHMFEFPFEMKISFSLDAIGLTLLYFITILLFSLIKCRKKVRKMKVCDLLYLEKKNESSIFKTRKKRKFLFILSILLGVVSQYLIYTLFVKNIDNFDMGIFFISLILMILCFYLFSMTVSSFIAETLLKRKKWKYKGENLFLLRNLSSKMNTMGFTLGTLSLLFFFTFMGIHVSLLTKGIFEDRIQSDAPYDVTIYMANANNDFTKYIDLIDKKYKIKESLVYENYVNHSHSLKDLLKEDSLGYQEEDGFIKLSDYNKLMAMQGRDKSTLGEKEFLIHTFPKYTSIFEKAKQIEVGKEKLSLKQVETHAFSTKWFPGSSYLVVVPDKYVDEMEIINEVLAVNTKEKTTEAFIEEIYKLMDSSLVTGSGGTSYEAYFFGNISVKGSVIAEQKTMIIVLGFSIFYMAFIFIATAATILSIQQLSDSAKYQFRYRILHQLGVEEKEMNGLIFKQLLTYFSFPILLPIIMSVLATLSIHSLFAPVMQNPMFVWIYILLSFVFFLFLYTLYFIMTYTGFKKNVRGVL